MTLWTLLFRLIYKKIGKYASVKFIFNQIAVYLAEKIELSSFMNLPRIRPVKKIDIN